MGFVRLKPGVAVDIETPEGLALEFPAGLVVPSRLILNVDNDPTGYDVKVDVVFQDGRYVCQELCVRQREGGPAVTGEGLRSVPVQRLVRFGIHGALSAPTEERTPDGATVMGSMAQPPKGLAKQGTTDEVLRWVAQIYELAVALNEPPTKSVQDGLKISRATAGRWVAEARKRGLIGDAAEERESDG